MNANQDYYSVLGLKPSATPIEIEKAFKDLQGSQILNETEGRKIWQAYSILKDPLQRIKYDLKRQAIINAQKGGLYNDKKDNIHSISKNIAFFIAFITFIAGAISLATNSKTETIGILGLFIIPVIVFFISYTFISLLVSACCCVSNWSKKSAQWAKNTTKSTIKGVSTLIYESTTTDKQEIQNLKLKLAELEKEQLKQEIQNLKLKLEEKEESK